MKTNANALFDNLFQTLGVIVASPKEKEVKKVKTKQKNK